MKVVFMGTGDIAIPSFKALIQSEFELLALVTQPDKPVGRKQILTPPRIKEVALAADIPVIQPEKIRTAEVVQELQEYEADVFVVMAYGQILPKSILESPKQACINLHASILPKHRGASCIQAAIQQGDSETGITVMHMTEGLDEGDIIHVERTLIGKNETAGELHDRLADIAPTAMLHALKSLKSGDACREPQDDSLSNYAPKLLRQHGEIDWSRPAVEIEKTIRAYAPWPGTYTTYIGSRGQKKRLKIFPQTQLRASFSSQIGEVKVEGESLSIQCGDGALLLNKLQPEGSKPMEVNDFLRGGSLRSGDILGGE